MKRQYFGIPPEFSWSANICVFANILGKRQYFMILLDFVAANIWVYFQYLFIVRHVTGNDKDFLR